MPRHASPWSDARRRSAILALALLAGACSPAQHEPGVERVVPRPQLARADIVLERAVLDEYRAPQGRVLSIPPALAPWRVDGGTARVVRGLHGDFDVLQVASSGAVSVVVPGPHDLGRSGALVLRVWTPDAGALDMTLVATDGAHAWSQAASVVPDFAGRGWRVLRARVPREAVEAETVGALEIQLRGAPGTELTLDAPVLEWSAPIAWRPILQHEGGAPFALELGGECRPSTALTSGRLLRGSARVPAAGARLTFGYGAIDPHRGRPSSVELVVRVAGERGFRRETRLAIGSTARWREAEIELEAAAGEELTLELELAVTGSGAACAVISTPQLWVPATEPPTVVLITSDTHRGDHLGVAGGAVGVHTPALDALAARGAAFLDCQSTTNITIPSHVAMLTGLHPRDSGLIGNNMTLGGGVPTLAEVFRAAGFTTLAVTSIDLLSARAAGVERGFDRMSWPENSRGAERAVELATQWLEQSRDRPVFFWLHLFDAHAPYDPPDHLRGAAGPRGPAAANAALDDDGRARIPAWAGDGCDVECVRGLYRAEVAHVDEELARLLALPRVAGAVIAFTGDHGEVLGTHGIYWAHKALYPDTLHVPLIVAWPGGPAGQRVEAPASNLDLGRTLLDLAGLREREFPGRNLFDALAARELGAEPRFALEGRARSASITFEGWHLILQLVAAPPNERHESKAQHQVELYELASDPACERDRVGANAARARELRGYLVRWLAGWGRTRSVGAVRTDAQALRELAALGYASDAVQSESDAPLFDARCECEWCARFR